MSKFIVLEGTDGSGKATQTELLCEKLDKMGVKYTRLAFPRYEEPSSTLLKMYLAGDFGKTAESVNPYAASVFFMVDRYASFKTDWQAAYENDEVIIADRYTTSNAVHQGEKLTGEEREKYLDWLFDFEYRLMGLPAPDKVIFLDMPSELAFGLINKRQGEQGDIHEKDHEYLKKCRENAVSLCDKYGWDRIACAEGGCIKAPEAIAEEVFEAVREVLGCE